MTKERVNLNIKGKILYIVDYDITKSGGAAINEREFINELSRRFGGRAYYIIPSPDSLIKKYFSEYDREHFFTLRPLNKYNPFSYFRYWYQQYKLANSLLNSKNINFIIFRLNILPFALWLFVRKKKVPYVIKTLGAGVFYSLSNKYLPIGKFVNLFNQRLISKLTKQSLGVDVCTQNYAVHFMNKFSLDPKQILWIDNATNVKRFYCKDKMVSREALKLSHFNPIIGFVGGKPSKRGGRQIIEAGRHLLGRYPQLGIVIVGESSDTNQLIKRAEDLEIQDRCVFVGRVPYEHVVEYINAFDVGVSFDTIGRLKNWGNSSQKIRQYIACGKPVISGPGGNSFIEDQSLGSIVPADDIENIAYAISKWLSLSPMELEKYRKRARDFAENYLSLKVALEKRISFWNERMEESGNT